jgi:hypothetical protein
VGTLSAEILLRCAPAMTFWLYPERALAGNPGAGTMASSDHSPYQPPVAAARSATTASSGPYPWSRTTARASRLVSRRKEAVIQAADSRRPRRWIVDAAHRSPTRLPQKIRGLRCLPPGFLSLRPVRGERAAGRQQHQEAVMSGRQGSASSAFPSAASYRSPHRRWQGHGSASYSFFPPSLLE